MPEEQSTGNPASQGGDWLCQKICNNTCRLAQEATGQYNYGPDAFPGGGKQIILILEKYLRLAENPNMCRRRTGAMIIRALINLLK